MGRDDSGPTLALRAPLLFGSVPPAGFEPAHHAPEACALSPELRGLGKENSIAPRRLNRRVEPLC